MFREHFPTAWAFHRNTSLWAYQPGGAGHTEPVAPFKEYPGAAVIRLPAAGRVRSALGALLARRMSCRRFGTRAVALQSLATLLHAGYGVHGAAQLGDYELLTRPVPSGGGLYPLEVYVLARGVDGLAPGIYHYAALSHALERLEGEVPAAARIGDLFLGQAYAADAALLLVLTAVLPRSMGKYADRGYRLILLEAGHVMQNLNLVAGSLGLASVNLGGFLDAALSETLGLDGEQEVPIYATAIGYAARGTRDDLRATRDE